MVEPIPGRGGAVLSGNPQGYHARFTSGCCSGWGRDPDEPIVSKDVVLEPPNSPLGFSSCARLKERGRDRGLLGHTHFRRRGCDSASLLMTLLACYHFCSVSSNRPTPCAYQFIEPLIVKQLADSLVTCKRREGRREGGEGKALFFCLNGRRR